MTESFSIDLDINEVDDYDPWYYPVLVNGGPVTLGKGTKSSHEYLLEWQRYRDGVLGDPLLDKLNFQGKSLRDYACNCGYWGLRAAQRGLKTYEGIEGRQVFIDQGYQLWSQNGTHSCNYQFIKGDVAFLDLDTPSVDISFCIGILYHLPDWQSLLRRVANSTREVIVLETRIHPSRMQAYPGDLSFNRIAEAVGTKPFQVPSLVEINEILTEAGWSHITTMVNHNSPDAIVSSGELFNRGDVGRVALIARRRHAGS